MRRAVSWTLLILLSLATLEVCARVDDWISFGAPLLRAYKMDDLFQQTPRGWRGVGNASYVKWRLNSEGFRGPEIRPEHGQIRVVTYGASETFGIYEDSGHEFPRVLERDLNRRAGSGRFEVINAGLPGMRVGSGITYLHDIGHALRPKVVVIYATPTHYIGVTRPYCGRPILPPPPQGFELPQLRMAQKVTERLKEVLPMRVMTALRDVEIEWTTRHRPILERLQPESIAAFDTDLRCAVRAIREVGAIPILVTHADRFGGRSRGPNDEYWLTAWRTQYPRMREAGLLDAETRANMEIEAIAREEQVPLVEAARALSGHREYFADYAHFSNLGAERMASLLTGPVLQALTPDRTGAQYRVDSRPPRSATLGASGVVP